MPVDLLAQKKKKKQPVDLLARRSASVQPGHLASALQGLADTASFGFADEIEGGARSLVQGIPYEEAVKIPRQRQEEATPSYYAGMAAGAFLPGLGIAGLAGRGATTAAQYGRAALGGLVEGGVSAFGSSEGGIRERAAAVPAGMAIGAATGAVGNFAGNQLARYADRRAVRDIDSLDKKKAERLYELAKEHGIRLTPAELTGLTSLMAQQKRVGQTLSSGDRLAEFYRRRADEEIDPAVNKLLDSISEFTGDEAAGENIRAAAKRALDKADEIRSSQSSPIYQRAFETSAPVDTSGLIESIDKSISRFPSSGSVAARLRKAKGLLQRNVIKADDKGELVSVVEPESRLDVLHGVKLELDQMLDKHPLNPIGRVERREITKLKRSLLEIMDASSPDYKEARAISADLAPGVDRVREGIVGTIAKLPDQQLRTVATRLFSDRRISPRSAREAALQLKEADPVAWQAIKREGIQEAWDKAGMETLGSQGAPVNRGAKFRKLLMGSTRQRQILQATLEPEEFRAVSDLAEVLEAAGRVKTIGSDTAWNQEMIAKELRESESPITRISKLANIDAIKQIGLMWDRARYERNAQRLVHLITSDDGIEKLRELKKLTRTQKFRRMVAAQSAAQFMSPVSRRENKDDRQFSR